jgi:hypothetical protein
MKMVWLLWGNNHRTTENPWVEAVFDDQVLAEMCLRQLLTTTNHHYWIQEKQITKA